MVKIELLLILLFQITESNVATSFFDNICYFRRMVQTWAEQGQQMPDQWGRYPELTPKLFADWYDEQLALSGQILAPPRKENKKIIYDPNSCHVMSNVVLSSIAKDISNEAMDWIERVTNFDVSIISNLV
jgi:hypothetical protein